MWLTLGTRDPKLKNLPPHPLGVTFQYGRNKGEKKVTFEMVLRVLENIERGGGHV